MGLQVMGVKKGTQLKSMKINGQRTPSSSQRKEMDKQQSSVNRHRHKVAKKNSSFL
jgi:hypothetical protein